MGNLYLAIESATKMCSVALFENDTLIGFKEEDGDYSHAEKLAVFVDELLKSSDKLYRDLAAVAVSSGPGSYTGLRIGLSLAKGICFSQQIPLISISTLKAMASGAIVSHKDDKALYCPMIDARRMEVYTAIYTSQLEEKEPVKALVLDENSLVDELASNSVCFFGDGADKFKDVIDSKNAVFLDTNFVSASHWGALIHSKFTKEEMEDLAYYEPFYYKDFRAGAPKKLL